MADYSTIKGFNVKTLASDPYASAAASGTWASGTNMPAGYNGLGGFGTATAATMAGSPAPTGFEYDGTTWTATPALNTSGAPRYYPGSLGTAQNAGMIIGGEPGVAVSETWNGSAWSEGSNINTGRNFMGGCGITTAGIIAGGTNPPSGINATVETYNGTSWTETQDVPTTLSGNQMGGTSTAAISVSGMDTLPNTVTAVTNEWDGTSWTAVNSVNTARDMMGGDGPTIATTLIYGGQVPPSTKQTKTEGYDGTTWTEGGDLATGRRSYGSAGSISASVFTGGDPSPAGQTEEWTSASPLSLAQEGQVWYNSGSKVLKGFGAQGTGAWASGGLLNAMTMTMGTAGTQTATLSFGGTGDPGLRKTNESYNGTTWTELADMQTARQGLGGFGTQTAAMAMGGQPSPSSVTTLSETWNGTSWTEGNDINTGRCLAGAAGTTTAGLFYTGTIPGSTTPADCESYDGTCWTATNDVNTARESPGKGGLQSTAMCAAGYTGVVAIAETFDGTCWTEVNDLNTARYGGGYSGDSSQGIIAGGNVGPSSIAEQYDGTSWTEVADLSRGRYFVGGAPQGGSAAGIIIGGQGDSAYPGTASQSVEEWAVPNATKTFTAS